MDLTLKYYSSYVNLYINLVIVCILVNIAGCYGIKSILLWNKYYHDEDMRFGFGQQPFIDHNCTVANCYVTNNRSSTDITNFDAIVFHTAEYIDIDKKNFPSARSPHQHYVYFNTESPIYFAAPPSMNGVFNLTMTYRLNSDIPNPYFGFMNHSGNIISPSINPDWRQPEKNSSKLNKYNKIYNRKTLAVAWLVSNCFSRGGRETYVRELSLYISVDIYGKCGNYNCSITSNCGDLISEQYFFYLAFENSRCKDYITEKVLTGLDNDAIPIVYGWVNITRFLPPKSYIDATAYTPLALSELMKTLMRNRAKYIEYFWWRNYYKTVNAVSPFCRLCEILNDKLWTPRTYSYVDIRRWWHVMDDGSVCVILF